MSMPASMVDKSLKSEIRSAFGHRSVSATMVMDTVSEDGEKGIVIALETPYIMFPIPERRTKAILERLQLERYRSDYLARKGRLPFDEVVDGDDPPDFAVRLSDGSTENVDCAALAAGDRRSAYQLWNGLRKRLIVDASPSNFSAIAGTEITVWFGGGRMLPPKRSDDEILTALIRALRAFRFDRKIVEEMGATGDPHPPNEHNSATILNGAVGFYLSVVPLGRLQTEFAQRTGFECSLSFVQDIKESDVARELQRVIRQHDKPSIDHLLVSAGGPDRDNVQYPADDFQLDLLSTRSFEFKNLKRVTLHRWLTGQFLELERKSSI